MTGVGLTGASVRLMAAPFLPRRAWVATAWYALVTIGLTWPLAANLRSAVAVDRLDPLLNTWILAWGAECVLRLLSGDLAAVSGIWHANIFYPEPYALAYSEHLFAQVIEALPIVAATRDPLLAYNVLFLSTFVLSALGAYLLVRELTGCPASAFTAGLFFGFALYRAEQLGHLQVLSSQWMPFVLFGLRRYFESGRRRALAGAGAAWIAQNLSCGYYLLYFSPAVLLYLAYEMVTRGEWRLWRRWVAPGLTVLAVVVATAPSLTGYAALRARGHAPRSPQEVDTYAANVYSYLTPFPELAVWGGRLSAWPQPEGALFPGLMPVALAAAGVFAAGRRSWRASRQAEPMPHEKGVEASGAGHRRVVNVIRRAAAAAAAAVAVGAAVWGTFVLFAGPGVRYARMVSPSAAHVTNVWPVLFGAVALLAILSPRFRAIARDLARSPLPFFAAALWLAFYLSLGRTVWSEAYRVSGATLYDWLYRFVPGFDGLRVPSRFSMVFSLCLAVLGGYGLREVTRRWRAGPAIALSAGLLFLVEATVRPFPVAPLAWAVRADGHGAPAMTAREAGAVYAHLEALPEEVVVAELPIGRPEDEARYLYFSTGHRRRLVNGYSGGFPHSYEDRVAALAHPPDDPDRAWRALVDDGVDVVVVHEWAFEGREGATVREWLLSRGARLAATVGADRVLLMPR